MKQSTQVKMSDATQILSLQLTQQREKTDVFTFPTY
jgi:hypothetical protein